METNEAFAMILQEVECITAQYHGEYGEASISFKEYSKEIGYTLRAYGWTLDQFLAHNDALVVS